MPYLSTLEVWLRQGAIEIHVYLYLSVTVEQPSSCSTEPGDDTAHFHATSQGLSVPHLTCWQTSGTSTARHCCGVFCAGIGYKTADLLTCLFCVYITGDVRCPLVKWFCPCYITWSKSHQTSMLDHWRKIFSRHWKKMKKYRPRWVVCYGDNSFAAGDMDIIIVLDWIVFVS